MTYSKRQHLLPYKPARNISARFGPAEVIKGEPYISPKGFRPEALLRLGYRLVYQFNAQFKITCSWMHHLKIPSEDTLRSDFWGIRTFYYHGTGSTQAVEPKVLRTSKGFTSLAKLYEYMVITYPESHDSHPTQLQLTKEKFPEYFI